MKSQSELLAGLLEMPTVETGGVSYSGAYLATQVAVNGAQPEAEAERTPELVLGLTRAVAKAQREMEDAKANYRHWRDEKVHKLTNSVQSAVLAGFQCACNPGKDSRGKDKPPKCPSASAAETYLRSLPEYAEHWATQNEREEAWAVLHGALEAARLRIWCLREIVRDTFGDRDTTHSRGTRKVLPPPPPRRRA